MSEWSFVLIPDPQHLATPANGWTSYYNGLRDWIVANVATHEIQFVGGLGDMVHLHGDSGSWDNAETALTPLFDLDIPVLLLAAGNHDADTSSQPARSFTTYNTRLGTDLYEAKPWFGGVYETGNAQNMWAEFTIGGTDYLAFMLEFHPRDAVMDWVSSVTATHPDHRVLILTHAFLHQTGVRNTWETTPHGPDWYFTEGTDDANSAEQMWGGWLRGVPGLLGIFNGHYISENVAYRVDYNEVGKKVLQGFYNWQEAGEGGRGRVVLMTVDEAAGTIRQRVVRTDLDAFETGTSNGFAYDVTHQMQTPHAVSIDGVLYGVNDGGTASAVLAM